MLQRIKARGVGVELAFVDGREPCPAPPDIKMYFPDAPVFRFSAFDKATGNYTDLDAAVRWVRELLVTDGPFDGILGFSQGANMATAVLAHGDDPGVSCLKLMVAMGASENGWRKQLGRRLETPLPIPSFHVMGRSDPFYPGSVRLSQCFSNPIIVEFDGDHRPLPADRAEGSRIADMIIDFVTNPENRSAAPAEVSAAKVGGITADGGCGSERNEVDTQSILHDGQVELATPSATTADPVGIVVPPRPAISESSSNAVWVENLPFSFDSEALEQLFAQYGELQSARCNVNRRERRTGTGCVIFNDSRAAAAALAGLQGCEIGTPARAIRLRWHRYHAQDSSGCGFTDLKTAGSGPPLASETGHIDGANNPTTSGSFDAAILPNGSPSAHPCP